MIMVAWTHCLHPLKLILLILSILSILFSDEETEDGSEDESGNRSDADDSAESGSGSESDENDSQSQSTQEDNASLLESTPEKRKADFDGRKEPKRRKVVDENLIKIPLDQG